MILKSVSLFYLVDLIEVITDNVQAKRFYGQHNNENPYQTRDEN